jgi:hypothetical protein
MPPLLTQIVNSIAEVLALPIKLVEEANLFIYAHLGTFGQLAFDLVLFYLLFLIAFKVTKAVFDIAFYVIVPSVVLSVVSSFVLPFAFGSILPVCVALLIVINVFRS